jgi:hypothetical protein
VSEVVVLLFPTLTKSLGLLSAKSRASQLPKTGLLYMPLAEGAVRLLLRVPDTSPTALKKP